MVYNGQEIQWDRQNSKVDITEDHPSGQLADELKQGKLQKRPQNWDFVPKITINSVL